MDKIGILWDLDGTIVESGKVFYEAYIPVFEKYRLGPVPSVEEWRGNYFGVDPIVFFRDHIEDAVSDEQLRQMKWDYLRFADGFLQDLSTEWISLIPGVDRVLREFRAKGYPMAIASTSWMPSIVHTLERMNILDLFDNIASANLLPSKPAPDVFQLAAKLVRIPYERCVVFEDSFGGMKGAKNAGMKCVGIGTSVPISQMVDADIRLKCYDDLRISDVEALID